MKKKILIIGNKGCLGSALQKELGCDGVDRYDFLTLAPYDIVINCAVEKFDRATMFNDNFALVNTLVESSLMHGFKLIQFSTVSIFDITFYGLTKKFAEKLIFNLNPKDFLILRMTNIYGPGSDSPANRFEKGEREIFGDGSHIKDHIHIRDIISAVKLAIKKNWTGTINLSSGRPATINEIYTRFGQGRAKYINREPASQATQLDNSRALSLGWKPTWSIYDGPTD